MLFQPMKPSELLKALEGYQNELEPERKALEAFYRQFRCPACQGECRKESVAGHVFAEGTLVPRSVLRCLTCETLFDPHTGLLLERGHPGRVSHNSGVVVPK